MNGRSRYVHTSAHTSVTQARREEDTRGRQPNASHRISSHPCFPTYIRGARLAAFFSQPRNGRVPRRETQQRCHEPASCSSTVRKEGRKEGHECGIRTLVTRVPGVPSTFPFVLARVQIIADSDIVCDEFRNSRGSRPGISTYTLNYESWSVMDKLEYATTTNLRLRLAGMLMDMWIFFLFVAIAGECKTILFSYLSFRSRYVTFRFDSTQFSDSRPPCACVYACVRVFPIVCIDSTSGSQRDLVRVLSLDVSIRITYAQQARAAR